MAGGLGVEENHPQCPAAKPFAVVKKATGDVVPGGCHATSEEALAHSISMMGDQPSTAPGKHRHTVFPMSRVKIAEPGDDGRRRIMGYASVFGNRDSQGDIVVKGAFQRSLSTRHDVKVLWQHDPKRPIGKQEAAFENEYGLAVVGALSDTAFVRDEALPLLKDGVVNGLSIGYDVEAETMTKDGNLLKDIELFEWSPVTFAANEKAEVVEVKSLDDIARADRHSETLTRSAKTVLHELEGYFAGENEMPDVDLNTLKHLARALAGKLGQTPSKAADAIEYAYLTGLTDGLNLKG